MKNIFKAVITGGPCAGKTTALAEISHMLKGKGYTVLFVNETATELIRSNVIPDTSEKGTVRLHTFQKLILDLQLAKEEAINEAVEDVKNDRVAILFDRGVFDNRAYIPHEEFKGLREAKGLTEEEIMDRYDLIIHLVSTAKDKKEVYNKGNIARMETVEEAEVIEDATMLAWPDNEKKYVLYNDCSFTEKIHEVEKIIEDYLNKKSKKYIIDKINLDEMVRKTNSVKTGFALDERISRTILKQNGHTYIWDIYMDGSDEMTIEMND